MSDGKDFDDGFANPICNDVFGFGHYKFACTGDSAWTSCGRKYDEMIHGIFDPMHLPQSCSGVLRQNVFVDRLEVRAGLLRPENLQSQTFFASLSQSAIIALISECSMRSPASA